MIETWARRMPRGTPLAIDVLERSTLLIVFVWTCLRFLHSMHDHWDSIDIALLLSEGAPVLFILTHRFTQDVSLRPLDWLVAFVGTYFPLLVRPSFHSALLPLPLCAALMGAGFLLQIMAKLTLRRSFGLVAANRGVKAGGPYRLLRHPMYAGYILAQVAFLSARPSVWNVMLYLPAISAQIFRILGEERVLATQASYRLLMEKVRWRLVPYVF